MNMKLTGRSCYHRYRYRPLPAAGRRVRYRYRPLPAAAVAPKTRYRYQLLPGVAVVRLPVGGGCRLFD